MAVKARKGGFGSGRFWQSKCGGDGTGVECLGRKFAEDWTDIFWHGKVGFGSRGGDWNDA
jgi:hypothetical protein